MCTIYTNVGNPMETGKALGLAVANGSGRGSAIRTRGCPADARGGASEAGKALWRSAGEGLTGYGGQVGVGTGMRAVSARIFVYITPLKRIP
jgi:hypothetical protein